VSFWPTINVIHESWVQQNEGKTGQVHLPHCSERFSKSALNKAVAFAVGIIDASLSLSQVASLSLSQVASLLLSQVARRYWGHE
ncbi:MAG: hypothetical protein L0H70_08370, partial [Xanthomonadales bacterium]|nr:hypothetical protein [Xanthomonadales bacterium]